MCPKPNKSLDASGGSASPQLAWCGEGFDSRRRVNSTVIQLFLMTRLSSWNTLFSKLFTVPTAVLLLGMLYLDPPTKSMSASRMSFIWAICAVIFLAFFAFGSWYSFRQKFVWANKKALHVSGLFSRCEIPLSNVDQVDESMFLCLVIVRLKSPSAFGRTIWFTPTWPFHHFFGLHPVTEQLRQLVRDASTVGAV